MASQKVSVIIVTYNSSSYIPRLIKDLSEMGYPKDNIQIIFVDNNSTDNTLILIRKYLKAYSLTNARVIRLNKNLGFPAALNIGIRISLKGGADYLLLLNPDIAIVDFNFILRILSIMKKLRLPVIGCALISGQRMDIIDSLGSFLDPLFSPGEILSSIKLKGKILDFLRRIQGKILLVPSACMACLMIEREAIERIGYLRNDYFMYFEDVEWCLRGWSKGIPIALVIDFMVWHARGGIIKKLNKESFTSIQYHAVKNILDISIRYGGILAYILKILIYFAEYIITRQRYLKSSIRDSIFSFFDVLRKSRISKLPRDLVLSFWDLRNYVLFWTLKYILKFGASKWQEAIKYGSTIVGFRYLIHKLKHGKVFNLHRVIP